MTARKDELTLNDVRQDFPGWICWRGTGRLLYARREQTPLGRYDVWGADPLDLHDAIASFLRTEAGAARPMPLPGRPAGLVLPPQAAPWWGWPGWRDAGTPG